MADYNALGYIFHNDRWYYRDGTPVNSLRPTMTSSGSLSLPQVGDIWTIVTAPGVEYSDLSMMQDRGAGYVTLTLGTPSATQHTVTSADISPVGSQWPVVVRDLSINLVSNPVLTGTLTTTGVVSRLNAFGDSTTYGQGASDTAHNYVSLYAAFLGIPPLNNGIPGTVLQNRNDAGGSPRVDNGRSRYAAALLGTNLSSKYALQYGFNDARYIGAPATMNPANFNTDYTFIINAMLANGIPLSAIQLGSPIFITDTGLTTGSTGFAGQTRDGFEQYITEVRRIADALGVQYVPLYEYMRDNQVAMGYPFSDNIHPGNAGYAGMAAVYENPSIAFANTTLPTAVSALVVSSAPTVVSVTLSAAMRATAPATSAFAIAGHTITAVSVSGRTLSLTVSAFTTGETLTLSYTKPGTNPLQDTLGNQMASFSGLTITNNVGNTTPRLLQRVFLNESGTDPSFNYSGTDGAPFNTTPQGGVLNLSLAAGANGSFAFKVISKNTGNTDQPMIGITTSSTLVAFASQQYALYESSSTATYIALKAGVSQTVLNTVVQAIGDIMRISVSNSGTTVTLEVSQNNGSTWVPIYTDTMASTQHYFQGICKGFPGIGNLTAIGLT